MKKVKTSFTFLITGKKSNDREVRAFVNDREPCVFYKLAYTAPYQEFQGIRKFQYRTRFRPFLDETGRSRYAAIDLSEWLGHEDEEYLEIFMKFLHDYREFFSNHYVFTAGTADREGSEELFSLAGEYLGQGNFFEMEKKEQENDKERGVA